MKRGMLCLISIFLILFSIIPASAYEIYVGSVNYINNGGYVYDSTGTLWKGDDFNGSAGSSLTSPPYTALTSPSRISLTGNGTLAMENVPPDDTRVALPNYSSTGAWLSINNAAFAVNFQNGAPEANYGFGIRISSFDQNHNLLDDARFEAVNVPWAGFSGLSFGDETTMGATNIFSLPITTYDSIGLALKVDADGKCTAYYTLNPADKILTSSDEWVPFGTGAFTYLNSSYNHEVRFYTMDIPASVPEPTTMLLLGLGLVELAGVRRKRYCQFFCVKFT